MKRRKRHTPEQIIRKLREADTMLAAGKDDRADPEPEGPAAKEDDDES